MASLESYIQNKEKQSQKRSPLGSESKKKNKISKKEFRDKLKELGFE